MKYMTNLSNSTNVLVNRARLISDYKITLNGKPAYLMGSHLAYAIVANETERYEWSWQAVEHIITNRAGAFVS